MRPPDFAFRIEELVDPITLREEGEEVCWEFFPDDSLWMLHGVREFFNRPVVVNNWLWDGAMQYRGYRPPWCVIGAPNSAHRKGLAFDLDVKGIDAQEVRRLIRENQNDPRLQLIQRMEKGVNWVHIDRYPPPTGKDRIYLFAG